MNSDNERGWYFRALGASIIGSLVVIITAAIFLGIGYQMGKPDLDPESSHAKYHKKIDELRRLINE